MITLSSSVLAATVLRWLPPVLWFVAIAVAVLVFAARLPPQASAGIQATDSTPAASSPWPTTDVFHQRAATGTTAPAAAWQVVSLRLAAPAGAILARSEGQQYAVQAGDRLDSGLSVLAVSADGVQVDDGQGPRWLQLPGRNSLLGSAQAHSAPSALHTEDGPGAVIAPASGWTVPAASPHSAALALAGLRPGDRIQRINDQPLASDGRQLTALLRRGQTLQLQWVRDGQTHTRAVRIP